MKSVLILSLCCLAVQAFPTAQELKAPTDGKTWVLLAGGGNGALDWAIQADIYHAYQVFVERGVPKENIIVMHRDNVANQHGNPTPGKVVHVPGGPDVYHGVPKDYTGKEVTPQNLLAILRADKSLKDQGKKVIESGPNDNVFLYIADHGATQVVVFPYGGYLHAKDLIDTIKQMHQDKRYANLVTYMMACESGSMFDKLLPNDINAYGVSSSRPDQLSYAIYWDEKYQEYLASYFTAVWLNDTETVEVESLEKQFKYIEVNTAKDYVDAGGKRHQNAKNYGDVTKVAQLSIGLFEGAHGIHKYNHIMAPITEIVSIRDAPLVAAEKRLFAAKDINEKLGFAQKLEEIIAGRQAMDKAFDDFVQSIASTELSSESLLTPNHDLTNGECYRKFIDTLHEKCFDVADNTYALSKFNVFINICEQLDANSANTALNQLVEQFTANSAFSQFKNIV